MATNIFEKILYGQKVNNDNLVIINKKLDDILNALQFAEEVGPDAAGTTKEE